MENKKSVFETLFEVNVNKQVEKKNGLNYLSWAYAWSELKKLYPSANYKVYETENGCIYHTDGKTFWVKTGVIIDGLEHIEYLPVMDYKNKSITLENITSFDVNKAIQRSLTKAAARHELGLYIYAGEDLPEIEVEKITPREARILKNIVDDLPESDKLYSGILRKYNIKSFKELSVKQRIEILQGLNNMERKAGKNDDKIHSGRNAARKSPPEILQD